LKSFAFNVGLTGGVGSGKSTIASMFSNRGAAVVDADAVAHQLTSAGGAAITVLRDAFGAEAIAADGSLDRTYMRARVFSDAVLRTKLERLLHPMIRTAMNELADRHVVEGAAYVVRVVPLLVEGGNWRRYADRLLLVDCSDATQVARVRARPGIDDVTARKIIAAQASRADRLAVADDVLFNEAPIDQIDRRVARLHQTYVQCAAMKRTLETL
jgi:dephospho-CoA kinase